jgi:hypothetical protein
VVILFLSVNTPGFDFWLAATPHADPVIVLALNLFLLRELRQTKATLV